MQLLINHRADPAEVEDLPTGETNEQHETVMKRRTIIEAAEGSPRILHVVHESILLQ